MNKAQIPLRAVYRVVLAISAATTVIVGTQFITATVAAAVSPGESVVAENRPGPVEGAMLKSGETLGPGMEIKSASGRYKLRQALDGNLFFLERGRVLPLWHAGTAPNPGASTHMQKDGNLVVRSVLNEPLWDTGTQGENVSAHVQDDGNLTLRTPSGEVLWALSDEIGNDAKLRPGEALQAGEERHSLNKVYTLRMQEDGNLVLTVAATKKVLWHSGTGARNRKASAHMQRDGNLVIYSEADHRSLWDTGTQGDDVTLHVQDDGNLTLQTPDGEVLWSRGGR